MDAIKKSCKYFDFNPSGGHEGVVRFKETFGTEKLTIKRWKWENSFIKKIAHVKRNIIGS